MPPPNLKDIVGEYALLALFIELAVWGIFVLLRRVLGKPIKTALAWRTTIVILTVGMLGAIMAPILIASTNVRS